MQNKTPIIVAAVFGMGLFFAAGWYVYSWLTGGDIEDVAEHLPEDTLAVFAFRGFADLFLEFEDELAEMGDSDEAEEAMEDAEDFLGVNPLDPESLAETGFSFSSPWAVAITGNPARAKIDVILLIPVDDEDDVADYMDDRADEMDWEVDDEDVGDLEAIVVDEKIAWVIDDDYLLLCIPVRDGEPYDGDEALDCLEELVELDSDDTLAESENFERAMELADPDWNLMVYTSTGWAADLMDNPGFEREMKPLADLMEDMAERVPAQVMTMAIERDEIRIQGISLLESEYAHLFAMEGEDELADRIPGEAIAVGRASSQIHAAWAVLMDWDFVEDNVEDAIKDFERESRIDIEEELMANLSGHVSALILEAEDNDNPVPVDVVLYAQVEDEELALDVVENLVDMAEDMGADFDDEEVGDSIYFITEEDGAELCIGVAREHIVAVFGIDRCERTFEGIEDGDESFLDSLPGDVEDGMEDGPSNYGYLSVTRLIDLIKSNSRGDEDELDVMEELIESVEFNAWTEEEHTSFEMIVRPPEDDFGPGLISWFELVNEALSGATGMLEKAPRGRATGKKSRAKNSAATTSGRY